MLLMSADTKTSALTVSHSCESRRKDRSWKWRETHCNGHNSMYRYITSAYSSDKSLRETLHISNRHKATVCFAQDLICCILPSIFYLSFFSPHEQPLFECVSLQIHLPAIIKQRLLLQSLTALNKIFLLRVSTSSWNTKKNKTSGQS